MSDLRPIDILTGEIAIEVTGVVGASPALWYFRYIATIFLTIHKRLCYNIGICFRGEWVRGLLFYDAKWVILWQEQLTFRWDEDGLCFVLDQQTYTPLVGFLKCFQQQRLLMDTLSWFIANQSLLFLLNAACLPEKQQIPIEWSLVCSACGLNPLSTTLEVRMLIFNTTDEVWRGLICEQKQSDNNSLFNPAIFLCLSQAKDLDFQCHMSWSFLCSMIWGER